MSHDDYIEKYGLRVEQPGQCQGSKDRWTLHRKLLWAVLATRRVVFIGFSMDDPYFKKMLETVIEDLWGWDKSIHFAIMSIVPDSAKDSKDKAEKFKNKYGVDTVFYENFDGSYKGLYHVVAEIFEQCNFEVRAPIDRVDGQPPIGEDESGWLEQANQRMERRIDHEN